MDKIKDLDKKKYFFISHRVDSECLKYPNIFYLTPLSKENYLYCDILPFMVNKIKNNIPIFVIQGNLNKDRRNFNLLIQILSKDYDYDYKIKLIGRGELPVELEPFKNKIILKNNLNFIDFHKEFLDAYAIFSLFNKESHPQYYTNQLTSTINYAKAYNLKIIIDKDLQDIYQLENIEVYTDNIIETFTNCLKIFYDKIKYIC